MKTTVLVVSLCLFACASSRAVKGSFAEGLEQRHFDVHDFDFLAGDRGEFYGLDDDDGRPVEVRFVWTRLGPDSARWEQWFSYDAGRSWEMNWTNTLTRKP